MLVGSKSVCDDSPVPLRVTKQPYKTSFVHRHVFTLALKKQTKPS